MKRQLLALGLVFALTLVARAETPVAKPVGGVPGIRGARGAEASPRRLIEAEQARWQR